MGARRERGHQFVAPEGGRKDPGRSQLQPVAHGPAVVDDEDGAAAAARRGHQIAIDGRKAGVGDQG